MLIVGRAEHRAPDRPGSRHRNSPMFLMLSPRWERDACPASLLPLSSRIPPCEAVNPAHRGIVSLATASWLDPQRNDSTVARLEAEEDDGQHPPGHAASWDDFAGS